MRVFVAPPPDLLDLVPVDDDQDFTYTVGGELLVPPVIVCDGPEEHRERCGCGRSMTGVASMRGTSLAMVSDLPQATVNRMIADSALVREWDSIGDTPGEFVAEQQKQVLMVAQAIQNAEGVPGDVFRVENGPNDDPYFKIRRAA